MSHLRITALLMFLLLVMVSVSTRSQERLVSPLERGAFAGLTSYDSLRSFLATVSSFHGFAVERIARTRQEREVSVVRVGSSARAGKNPRTLRVLLFAQQHGDEPSGKEALLLLLAKLASGERKGLLDSLDLFIVPQMNPDGAEARRRLTSDSIDLNRNHVLLSAPETKGLHDLYVRWLPEVTLDVHEYSSFSRSWSDSGFIKTGDVQFGMLTNLNTSPVIRSVQHAQVFPFIAERMQSAGYSFHEYIVGSPGTRIRHSTTEFNDGRQSFGILGSLSFIQEGRKWKTREEQLERRALSQLASIEALLEFCARNASGLRTIVSAERRRLVSLRGKDAVVQMEHVAGDGRMSIPVLMTHTNSDTSWSVRPYHGEVHSLRSAVVPQAYIIPRELVSVVELLQRHHVRFDTTTRRRNLMGSSYVFKVPTAKYWEEDSLLIPVVEVKDTTMALRPGDLLVPTAQLHGLFLATLLEPESMWGLTKYKEFAHLTKQTRYPILRVR